MRDNRAPTLTRRLLLGMPGIVALDSTWQAEGGGPGREAVGFRAHIALAHQPQFASLISFSNDNGAVWGSASGTWIGDSEGVGYILTAGHVFARDGRASDYVYRSVSGAVHRADRLYVHPAWNWFHDERTGYDIAIVRLRTPITDAGFPPALYAGRGEMGKRIVMVGFGNRGIGSVGEKPVFYRGSDKAAAENTVDDIRDGRPKLPPTGDAGNWLGITFRDDRETPGVTRLEGILGSGDSGGSAWMQTINGWVIVGVNANGDGDTYGSRAYFARVSGARDWIGSILPSARFVL